MERLHALLILAWALIRSLVAPMIGARRGLSDFRRSYAADRLPPVTADERRYLQQLSGCIACGLCNAGEGQRMAASGGAYAGVMDLMLASSRSMPDYDAAARSFAVWATSDSPSSSYGVRSECPCESSPRSCGARRPR